MANFFCIQQSALYIQSRDNEYLPEILYTTQEIKDILCGQYYYFFNLAQRKSEFPKPASLILKDAQPIEYKRILRSINRSNYNVMLSKEDKKICQQIYLHLWLPYNETDNDDKIIKI